jgi:hypothetical protein
VPCPPSSPHCVPSITPCSSNVSYGVPTLDILPPPHEESDLFLDESAFPSFEPVSTKPFLRPHRNTTLLNPLDYVPMTNDTHAVTDCNTTQLDRVAGLIAGDPRFFRVDLADAVLAANASLLRAEGYLRPDGSFVSYLGGGLFFMRDGGVKNRFAAGGQCTVWLEQLVLVATDAHWVTLTGTNFAAGFSDPASANVRAVIDGVVLPAASVVVRDHELVDVLVPSALGRRRLQLDVDGVRTGALLLVNAKPVVHGFMEWRLGVEDIRGFSPAAEDPGAWNDTDFGEDDPLWGGYGAWNTGRQCMSVALVGFHFGGAAHLAGGLVAAVTGDRACEVLEHARHTRITCCTGLEVTFMVVYVGGQRSTPVAFEPTKLVRKPVVLVRDVCASVCV